MEKREGGRRARWQAKLEERRPRRLFGSNPPSSLFFRAIFGDSEAQRQGVKKKRERVVRGVEKTIEGRREERETKASGTTRLESLSKSEFPVEQRAKPDGKEVLHIGLVL